MHWTYSSPVSCGVLDSQSEKWLHEAFHLQTERLCGGCPKWELESAHQ